jgi:hypothetical protein
MTAEEKEKFTKMEQSVEEIKQDISVIKSALVGNELTKDSGLIGRVTTLQAEIEFLKNDLKVLQDERTRNSVYIKQLSFVTGVLVTAFLAGVIKILFF